MKRWILVLVLVAAMVATCQWLTKSMEESKPKRVEIENIAAKPEKKATLNPGKVVQLNTNRGEIEFVLFEKDCPITTKRVADLIDDGKYNGVIIPRVEPNYLIQTDLAKKDVKPIRTELLDGLTNVKGAVGLARQKSPNSGKSSFYILLEPKPHLDYKYTVFGRVIKGMDVVMSIKKGDVIRSAKTRKLTPQDIKLFEKQLQIESERRVN